LSGVSFLVLRDARGLAQVVVDDPQLVTSLSRLHNESVLEVEGTVLAEAQAPAGVEVRQPTVSVIAAAAAAPPVDLFRPTLRAQLPTAAARHRQVSCTPCWRASRRPPTPAAAAACRANNQAFPACRAGTARTPAPPRR